jgi:hypothetical protein
MIESFALPADVLSLQPVSGAVAQRAIAAAAMNGRRRPVDERVIESMYVVLLFESDPCSIGLV